MNSGAASRFPGVSINHETWHGQEKYEEKGRKRERGEGEREDKIEHKIIRLMDSL